MKRRILILVALLAGVGVANAAVRGDNTLARNARSANIRTTTERVASPANKSVTSRDTSAKNNTQRTTVSSRVARTATQPSTQNRQTKTVSVARSASVQSAARSASVPRTANVPTKKTTARSATTVTDSSANMGTGYTTCRDAYFTCMDQFCGTANDTYRRCICSSKLTEIQNRERALSQASTQIEDFKGLNLNVIDKTPAEVNAMLSASEGEIAQSSSKDKSDSAKQLSGISAVLSKTKTQSLSTQGTLDIAGDINAIWSTTDLTGGANISNLTGEALYNAVHAQCVELVADACPDTATKTMVVSAYGMYIENDCSLLINGLDKQLIAANATIRDTEYEMGDKRLKNYNTHNSSSINDCIAQVRLDITSNTACGTDYVHCLDVTGQYLNYETGEPIYTSNFFELDSLTSLSGDLLTNQANRMTLARLQNMRDYAERGLDTCRDISDDVWDEFLRQAITEIHQGQQERIRQVKDECLDVVNKCYDEQTQQLKNFDTTTTETLLGSRLELSEKMCQEKLDACSNVYGGGTTGFQTLLTTMYDIIDQQIAQQCINVLQSYLSELCAVPGNDTLHSYPYGCRMYTPGYMTQKATETETENNQFYSCPAIKRYVSCKPGYTLIDKKCVEQDHIDSMYYKLEQYAKQACVRPSQSDNDLPPTVLQDINTVMDQVKFDMATELAKECERQDGIWESYTETTYKKTNSHSSKFYTETSADKQWGLCTITLGASCTPDDVNAISAHYSEGQCVPTECAEGYVMAENSCKKLYSVCNDNNTEECCKDMPKKRIIGPTTSAITQKMLPRYDRVCLWDNNGNCACLCNNTDHSTPTKTEWIESNIKYEGYLCPIKDSEYQNGSSLTPS